jgi:membrane-associated protease RseP (regulator of RpoE activity)
MEVTMNERKDRTILIVSIIVIVGVLVSLIGACLTGGLMGYLVSGRQARAITERCEMIEKEIEMEMEKHFYPPRFLPEEEISPFLPEAPEKPRGFPEGFPPFPLRPGGELSGALIREVVPDTPADRAGLQEDDLIIAVDGQPVDDDHPLQALIGEHRPGDHVEITYLRGEEEQVAMAKLGEHPDDPEQPYLGVYFVSLSIQQRFERRFEEPNG